MVVLLILATLGGMFAWYKRNQQLKKLALGNPLMAPGLEEEDIAQNIRAFRDDMKNERIEGTETVKVYKHIIKDVLNNAEKYEEGEFDHVMKALEKLRVTMVINSNVGMKAQNQMIKLREDAHKSLEKAKTLRMG